MTEQSNAASSEGTATKGTWTDDEIDHALATTLDALGAVTRNPSLIAGTRTPGPGLVEAALAAQRSLSILLDYRDEQTQPRPAYAPMQAIDAALQELVALAEDKGRGDEADKVRDAAWKQVVKAVLLGGEEP